MSETNERSVASAGSVAERPLGDPEIALELLKLRVAELEEALAERDGTLTDAEREAVRFCVTASLPETEKLGGVAGELCRMHTATLRGLLDRLK